VDWGVVPTEKTVLGGNLDLFGLKISQSLLDVSCINGSLPVFVYGGSTATPMPAVIFIIMAIFHF
jgi:hypothetical protein